MKLKFVLSGLFFAFFVGGCEDAAEMPSTTLSGDQNEILATYDHTSMPVTSRQCGTTELLEQHLKDNPGLSQKRESIEAQTQAFIKAIKAMPNGLSSYGGPVTIPVVVHVLYNTDEENISDEQIQSQIDVLNKDFNGTNEEVLGRNLIPTEFRSTVANINISFTLAEVTRKYTSNSVWNDESMKFESRGGVNAWDASKYLNIWVCNLSGGLLGFATLPGAAPARDGVVVTTKAFGDRGILYSDFNKGRTATHEVGHWLNLYHTFNGGCSVGDLVSDTPAVAAPNFGCPSYPTESCGSNDMTMNFMDYTNDACMYMFSKGQKERMRALFVDGGARASLVVLPNPVSQ